MFIDVLLVLLSNHTIDFLSFIATFLEIWIIEVNIDSFLLVKPHLANTDNLLNDFMRSSQGPLFLIHLILAFTLFLRW